MRRLLLGAVLAIMGSFFTMNGVIGGVAEAETRLYLYGNDANTAVNENTISNWDPLLTHNILARSVTNNNTEDNLSQGRILSKNFISTINIVVGVLAIFYLILTGVQMISTVDPEQKGEYRQHLLYIILALLITSAGEVLIFQVFDPNENDVLRGNSSFKLRILIEDIITYVKYAVAGLLIISGAMAAMKMVLAVGGDSDAAAEWGNFGKKLGFGVFVILFAEMIVITLAQSERIPENNIPITENSWTNAVTQIIGITNFLLTFLAVVGVVMILVASFLWITSTDNESQVQRAQQIIKGSVIGIVVAISAYTLVNFLFV